MTIKGRPHTLKEVADRTFENPSIFGRSCNEFCDHFYFSYPHKELMQACLDPEPLVVGDAYIDAMIGAVGEHMALRWHLETPSWVFRVEHYQLTQPVFLPPSKALAEMLIAESPAAFRSRLIFTMAEPLQRARFPADVEKITMPWSDQPDDDLGKAAPGYHLS